MALELTELYVCERCFSTDTAPGPCPRCGRPRRDCHPGEVGDERRRPPMDARGHILSRAPLWWVLASAPDDRARAHLGRGQ